MNKTEYNRAVIFGSGPTEARIPALAAACGVSVSTMYRYRESPEDMPAGVLLRIAKIRGVNLEDLKK